MDAARDAAERYVEALKEGDGEAACDALSRGTAEQLEDQADKPCPEALTELLGAVGADSEELDDLKVSDVNVAGDVATVTIKGAPRGQVTSQMTRERGEWKLVSVGG